jgi:hypothetical protein
VVKKLGIVQNLKLDLVLAKETVKELEKLQVLEWAS